METSLAVLKIKEHLLFFALSVSKDTEDSELNRVQRHGCGPGVWDSF